MAGKNLKWKDIQHDFRRTTYKSKRTKEVHVVNKWLKNLRTGMYCRIQAIFLHISNIHEILFF